MTDDKGHFITKKKRGRQICNQRANSVADMAAVLGMLGTEKSGEIGLKGAIDGQVEIRWSNLNDAEFAETWGENVVHDILDVKKNNRDLERLSGQVLAIRAREEEKRATKEERQRMAKETATYKEQQAARETEKITL